MVLMQQDLRLRVDGVPRVEERCEENARFPLLQNVLEELVEHIAWRERGQEMEMGASVNSYRRSRGAVTVAEVWKGC